MIALHLILLVVSLVLFILAGLGVPNPPRFQFIGWGLAFVVLAFLISTAGISLH